MTTERIQTLEEAIKAEQEALHTTRALWEKARFEAEARAIKADIRSSIAAARAEMAVLYTTPWRDAAWKAERRRETLWSHIVFGITLAVYVAISPVAGGIMTAESERIEALEEALKVRHDADRVTKREAAGGLRWVGGKPSPWRTLPWFSIIVTVTVAVYITYQTLALVLCMNRTATRQWRRLRQVVLQRDGGRCQIGDPGCLIAGSEIDHIVPVREGGSDDPLNLRVVCRPCHRHRRRKASRAW